MMKRKVTSLVVALAVLLAMCTPALAVNVNTTAVSIDGGLAHSIALGSDGNVYVWGDNTNGQLGLGSDIARQETPTKVPDLTSVTAVAAGYNFCLALRFNGTVVGWGNGLYKTPTEVVGLERVVAISAGQMSCLALTADGRVFQWEFGKQWPAQVYGMQNVVAISAGGNHNMALTRNGNVWTWGFNERGQLGDGTTTERQTPKQVGGLLDIVDIAAGVNHSLAVDFHGNVYAWGDNAYYQLGRKDLTAQDNLTPMKVSGVDKAVQVVAGNGSSMALTSNGQVYSWGYGEYGQLGNDNTQNSRETPAIVNKVRNCTTIACGAYHDLCVTKTGDIYAWGRNNYGQIGNGKNGNASGAVKVNATGVTGMEYSTCVLNGISSWAQEEVSALYPRGMVPPSLLTNYQGTITRAQLAHLLVSVYESVKTTVNVRDTKKFTDIDAHPMKDSILKAYSLGIINGTTETTFSPWGQVTRQEAVTMLCRFVSKMTGTTIPQTVKNLSYYDDAAQVAEWAAPYVDYAYTKNIMKGSGSRFSPTGAFTVEQSLLTVARLMTTYGWSA